MFPRNESIPRQSRGSRSKPPLCTTHPHDLGSIRPPSLFPKPLIPGVSSRQRREATDNQVRFQRALRHGCPAAGLGSSAGCGSFTGEAQSHTRSTGSFPPGRVLRVLPPHPAPQTPQPFPARGADGAPGGGFPPGWGWSSHMQPLQTRTALPGPSKWVCLSGRNSSAAGVLGFHQNNVRLGV